MNNDIRIIELLTDMLHEQRKTNDRLEKLEASSNFRLEKLEEQQAKTNLGIGELRLSFMKLAEDMQVVFEHEKRIIRLEDTVYHS